MSDEKAAAVWSDADTYATCLLVLGLDRYGRGVEDPASSPIHWNAETWLQEIHDDTGVELPVRNLDRLMAACLVKARPHEFYDSEKGFNDAVLALCAAYFSPTVWHPPTVDEVLWALVETYLFDPPDPPEKGADPEPRFAPGVNRYINMIAREGGLLRLPQAFTWFGVAEDPEVWRTAAVDYSADPEVNLAVTQAAGDRERDLDLDTADRLRDLSGRVASLPLTGQDPGPVAAELLAFADRLGAEAPADPSNE